jgi:hypothetical protein
MYEHDTYDDSPMDDDTLLRAVPDLGGLPVEDASGLSVGRLFGALTEADTGLVRYIDLSLDRFDRHVLVPIGHVRIREPEREGPRVRLRAALMEELEQIPPFPADVSHIDDPFERALLEAYGRSFHGERYYAHPSYDHSGIYAGEHPVIVPADGEDTDDGGVMMEHTHRHGGHGGTETRDVAAAPDVAGQEPADARDATADADVAGSGPAHTRDADAGASPAGTSRLRRLAYMPGWRVARGEPDVRGWQLHLDDGADMRIADLLIDPDAGRVRYVVVELEDGRTSRLLPIGFLQIRDGQQTVLAPGLKADDVRTLPEYDGGGLTRPQEDDLCSALRGRMTGRRRYHLPDYRPQDRLPGA